MDPLAGSPRGGGGGGVAGSGTPSSMQPTVGKEFEYSPLDSSVETVRLLILQPGSPDSDCSVHNPSNPSKSGLSKQQEPIQTVSCRLVHVSFRSRPIYEAISYTWGDPGKLKEILVNGQKMTIRENLYWALYHFRHERKERTLWADAICIDQSNIEERNYQVSLMGFIYSRAQTVLIWLGCYPSTTGLSDRGPSDRYESSEVSWLVNKDYWHRVWIIQEIGLATRIQVIYGRFLREWQDFISHLDSSRDFRPQYSTYTRTRDVLKLAAHRAGRHGNDSRLETLLVDFRYSKCTDPRDKIYGFLSLSPESQDEGLQADYSKSLVEVHGDVIQLFCRLTPVADETSLPENIERQMKVGWFSALVQNLFTGGVGYTPPYDGTTVPAERPKRQKTPLIKARAAMMTEILHVGPTCLDVISSSRAERSWKASFGKHYTAAKDIKQLRETYESYIPVLLALSPHDLAKLSLIDPDLASSSSAHDDPNPWIYWPTSPNSPRPDEPHRCTSLCASLQAPREVSDPMSSFFSVDLPSSQQPLIMLGTHKHIGLVPSGTQPGDIVCQFWQCAVTFVLRAKKAAAAAAGGGGGGGGGGARAREYEVVGKAMLASTWLDRELRVHGREWNEPGAEAEAVVLGLDVDVLQRLTC